MSTASGAYEWNGAAGARPARVGRIPYVNSAPYFLRWPELEGLSEGRWRPAELVPRALGRAADAGAVDAGLFAEADLARLWPEFEPLRLPEPVHEPSAWSVVPIVPSE